MAFGEIVARCQNMIFAYAQAILKDYYLAEDAAQEASIVAWQKLDQIKELRYAFCLLTRLVGTSCRHKQHLLKVGAIPAQVTDFKENLILAFDLSPDGKRIVCSRGVFSRDAILISDLRE